MALQFDGYDLALLALRHVDHVDHADVLARHQEQLQVVSGRQDAIALQEEVQEWIERHLVVMLVLL